MLIQTAVPLLGILNKFDLFNFFLSVSRGIIYLSHSHVLVLLLVMFIFVGIFGLAVFLIVWRLIRIRRAYRKLASNGWIDEASTTWRKGENNDLSMHTFTEQQWLFGQFLFQGHEDADTQDLINSPKDFWS